MGDGVKYKYNPTYIDIGVVDGIEREILMGYGRMVVFSSKGAYVDDFCSYSKKAQKIMDTMYKKEVPRWERLELKWVRAGYVDVLPINKFSESEEMGK